MIEIDKSAPVFIKLDGWCKWAVRKVELGGQNGRSNWTYLNWLIKVIYLVRHARLINNPVDIETNDFEN